jgi:glycosyltransferase involved in cell wall biosynthesis
VETDDADMAARVKRALGLDSGAALKDLVGPSTTAPTAGLRLKARLIDTIKGVFAFPDTNRGWISIAAAAARQALLQQEFDLVLTTSPPPSAHVAGRRIKAESHVPWVADLRDLWSDDRFSTAPRWRRAIDRRFEQRTLAEADALVTVSEPLASELRQLHPGVPTHTVLNGFDPDLVNPGEALPDVMTLTHTGTYHQGRRDPSLLFQAVGNLVRRGSISRDRFRIRLFVKHEPWLSAMAEKHDVTDLLDLVPWGSFEDALQAQRQSHVLLLLHWGGPREAGVVTAKVFEYLAARRPILVLGGGPGALRDILDDTGGGLQITSVDELEKQLSAWWSEFERTGTIAWSGDPQRIKRYSHVRMIQEFADVFETLVSG